MSGVSVSVGGADNAAVKSSFTRRYVRALRGPFLRAFIILAWIGLAIAGGFLMPRFLANTNDNVREKQKEKIQNF
jgi:hypothetical protein